MTSDAFENQHRTSLNIHDADDHFSLLTNGRMLQFQTALVLISDQLQNGRRVLTEDHGT